LFQLVVEQVETLDHQGLHLLQDHQVDQVVEVEM
jgi:hypothetical protein